VMDLVQFWYAAIEGKAIAREDIEVIAGEADSDDPARGVMANTVLFLAGDSSSRESAFERLKGMCVTPKYLEHTKGAALLLLVLERFSRQQIYDDARLAEFVYVCAAKAALPVRLNAMRPLRRLARFGERRAMELLKQSVDDSDRYVRETAEKQLKLASGKAGN
jgi:hypothetical protein